MKIYYWIIAIVIIVFAIAMFFQQNSQPIACTQEAKICPDGSAVGRIAPNCEFAPCPSEINCSLFSADNCPNLCVVCPPCEVCSSISCQTEEFCKSIGFDRSWWESVRPKNICKCPDGFIPSTAGNYCVAECKPGEACPAIAVACQNVTNNQTTDELCTASGGTVTTRLCCQSSGDFPNTCLIGACGCSPDNSHDVKVCDCGEGKCWDSAKQACVAQ